MSNLETQISPEIVNDEFSELLKLIASQSDVETVLEIGTGSGDGSTKAIVAGLDENINQNKSLYTIEISQERYMQAGIKYKGINHVYVLNGCSVPVSEYMTDLDVSTFYSTNNTALNNYPLKMVLQWKTEELEYIKKNNSQENLIEKIKDDYKIKHFDLVLIDGSEFTGEAELSHVIGAKYIALDDINAAKNFDNYHTLNANDSGYTLYHENWNLRNGFAIFKKI